MASEFQIISLKRYKLKTDWSTFRYTAYQLNQWRAQDVGSEGPHFQNPNSPEYLDGQIATNVQNKGINFQSPNSPETI